MKATTGTPNASRHNPTELGHVRAHAVRTDRTAPRPRGRAPPAPTALRPHQLHPPTHGHSPSGHVEDSVFLKNVQITGAQPPLQSFSFFITSQTQGYVPIVSNSQDALCLQGSAGQFVGPSQVQNLGATRVT